jgi:Thioredoxin-like
MTALRRAVSLASLILSFGLARGVALADEPARAVRQNDDMLVTLTGIVHLPDGSPAQGAIVESKVGSDVGSVEPLLVARTDGGGRFQLRGMFGNGAQLYGRSADTNHQTTLIIPAMAVRSVSASATPVELKLTPAIKHEILVLAEGRPAEHAQVVASGHAFRVRGATGADGKLRLQLPASERLQELVAWHRKLGVAGVRGLEERAPEERTQLSLMPPGPLRIRVVDPDGDPVRGLELGVSILSDDSHWVMAKEIAAAHVRTEADGTANVLWAPRAKLKYVDVDPVGADWKFDATDVEHIADRVVTVHARRKIPTEGRLVMPAGVSPQGLLVKGFGYGPANVGDIPCARARADGSFSLRVASAHGYALGIVDLEWAADFWTGQILPKDTSKPADITMSVHRAAPVTIRVTRGPSRDGVANAWVEVGGSTTMQLLHPSGNQITAMPSIRSWLRTDGNGVAHAGASRGKYQVRVSSGAWDEQQTIAVSSEKPLEVAFHRPWQGDRHLSGRLTSEGKLFEPSPALMVRAWTYDPRFLPPELTPDVKPDGTFKVVFDAENLSLVFSDPQKHRSGFAQVGLKESSLDVNMTATAVYSGTVLDENGLPMSGQTLELYVKTLWGKPLAAGVTDSAGRFQFAAAPATVPLVLTIGRGEKNPEYFIPDPDRMFQPGELRENDVVKPRRSQSADQATRPSRRPLADEVATACRNVRPSGMRALVVLLGDDSGNVASLANALLDEDRASAILSYLAVRVEAAELKTEAATIKRFGWPIASPGRVVLVALGGNEETIAAKPIEAYPRLTALATGDAFLKQHMPPVRDALATVIAAREEARKTGRRVWIVHGGPRCGPCFQLARWIDEHHATLEKDFVMVKVMEGCDEHAAEVISQLPGAQGDGIPWFAITEPDGAILTTSHGALGNIGFPGSVEGVRHFRQMLDRTVRKLSAAELNELIKSLSARP